MFDAGEVDAALRAARLRLSLRESAAMISTALFVLTGLAGFILESARARGQGHTNGSAAAVVENLSFVFLFIATYLVGRLVNAAKTANAARATDADGGIAMVQHPPRTSTGYSSV